ncbi:MAG: AraC family transcriptional regulator [Oscillospiraceae bacterium]
MEKSLLSMIDLLEFDTDDILFHQQEGGQIRTPFAVEREVLAFVAQGEPKKMLSHYRKLISANPNIKISVAKLSKDQLQSFRYMAVSAVAIVCRVAILNGVAEAVAYSISDDAIHKIDKMNSSEQILLFSLQMVYKYTSLVGKSKVSMQYSKPIRKSIEYIVANLHAKISLDDLVKGSAYNKEYFAKLFKKEVGMSIADYILDLRIQEAKKMILDGKSSKEIAYVLQFCSQSYFIQQFKKHVGITPHDFKQTAIQQESIGLNLF